MPKLLRYFISQSFSKLKKKKVKDNKLNVKNYLIINESLIQT